MQKDHFQFLRAVYFFEKLSDEEIRIIQKVCYEENFKPREIIFFEASAPDKFYIVLDGIVEVWKNYNDIERECLAEHGTGHLFGEMALVDELPRSATVVAKDNTRLLFINRDDFHRIITENSPIALSILKSVSAIIRTSNETFVENLRERNRRLEKAYHDLKEAQEELVKAERLSTLGKFSSLILHDIRNPLSVLRGYAEMILFHPKESSRTVKNAQKIIAEADRLNRLASELLDFSKGDIRLNMAIVDLEELVHKVMQAVGDKYRVRGIDIQTKVEYKGPVLLDEDRMYRVFLNLMDNARKAMPRGGTISVHISQHEKMLSIKVADTGVGMSEDISNKIFEPFYSNTAGGGMGTGLGMSIVKSIVEAHEGSLSVSSERSKGTEFTIDIPTVI